LCTAAKGRRADVAVIGSGPVGLKLALDLADAGLDVVLIDSGRDGNDPAASVAPRFCGADGPSPSTPWISRPATGCLRPPGPFPNPR
jgi:flavin-dependent dehydrogenase